MGGVAPSTYQFPADAEGPCYENHCLICIKEDEWKDYTNVLQSLKKMMLFLLTLCFPQFWIPYLYHLLADSHECVV